MPYNWTPTSERQMLLLAITKANLRPTSETWAAVASHLGNGLTPSAVSQKFYKLRNESATVNGSPGTSTSQSTPRKRKRKSKSGAEHDDTNDEGTIEVTPMRLIADRPFNKMHQHDQKGQDGSNSKETPVKTETPSKKQKIKDENFDGDDRDSDGEWVG